jgi:hypothetical protein
LVWAIREVVVVVAVATTWVVVVVDVTVWVEELYPRYVEQKGWYELASMIDLAADCEL